MKTTKVNAGYIELSGKVIVSDPCYDRSVCCMATGVAVKPGTYATYIIKKNEKDFGVRVAAIVALHIGYIKSMKKEWTPYDCDIGVDSGQCGIFDDAAYPADEKSGGEFGDETSFYDECCMLTLGKNQGGVLIARNGVVSSSGYGDGSYELLYQCHEGERVALMVNFDLEKNSKIMKALVKSQRNRQLI